jgi:N-methylhydantoinase A
MTVEGRSGVRVGIDVGGTFTDLVVLTGDKVRTIKVPTTRNQADGVLVALDQVDLVPAAVDAVAHGTTIATNALLERRGARTGLITTEGFRDLIEIARQNRAALYDLTARHPSPLVSRDLRLTVSERMGPDGVVVDLDEDELQAVVKSLRDADVDAVAVSLLFSFLHPDHEQRIGRALDEHLSGVHVSLSSEVLPEFREYERTSTTVANAYLTPLLERYLNDVNKRVTQRGYPELVVMQSSGGVVHARDVVRKAAGCVLSGPAGGVVGAAYVAEACGYRDVLSFDMGGTSTDVAPVVEGRIGVTMESVVAGIPIRLPMIDVHTVSAGGGSIARLDAGGVVRVGPTSAGADPGPACYGRGGNEPTVTDANAALGYLADGAILGGAIEIDAGRARDAIHRLAQEAGLEPDRAARGIVEVANATMAKALRVISVERGLDPRDFALVAFGGAGPLHACDLADTLAMGTVLVPPEGGVLSAMGLAISDVRRDYVRSLPVSLRDLEGMVGQDAFAELEQEATREMGKAATERFVDLRYAGQSYEITVPFEGTDSLGNRFEEAHGKRYGYAMPDRDMEAVAVRLVATLRVIPPVLRRPVPGGGPRATRRAFFSEWMEVPVFQGEDLGSGSLHGPSIVEFEGSTCAIGRGWSGRMHPTGVVVLERQR